MTSSLPKRLPASVARLLLHAALAASLGAACGEDAKPAPADPAKAGASAGGEAGAAAGGSPARAGAGAEAGAAAAGGSGILLPNGGGAGSGGNAFVACAKESAKADFRPLDLYIVLDRSGSQVGAQWAAVAAAVSAFVKEPGATGVGAGIQFFPLPDDANVCRYEAYAVPSVPIASLPENAAAIDTALAKNEPPKAVGNPTLPTFNTPTLPALQGAYDLARSWATAHPERTVVVLLATDGEPNGCGSTTENVTQVAANAKSASPSTLTFVVGIGKELASLNGVALAGGSESAILIDAQVADVKGQFQAALQKVRGQALPCSLVIPKATGVLDYNLVNVRTKAADGTETILVRVPNAAACGGDGVGWYYDDPAAPKEVRLCASSCQSIRTTASSLDIVFGCESVVKLAIPIRPSSLLRPSPPGTRMTFSRPAFLRIAGLTSLPFLLLTAACGGDEASTADTPGPSGGKSGSGGVGGATGAKGGAAGASTGGAGTSGGGAGSGGQGGKAGAAGNAGTSGAAGTAGAAGASGGAGSAGAAGAGPAAGAAGAAGSGNGCSAPAGAECDTKLKGICGKGHEKCIQGVLSCVQDTGPGEKAEVCNGLDDDCDGVIDNGLTVKTFFKDEDGDGYGSNATASGCAPPAGYVEKGNDCIDTNPNIYPNAIELCNDSDDNCNGSIDEGVQKPIWYKDSDGDGFGSAQQTVACFHPQGFVKDSGDCSDGNPDIYPGAKEACNEIDDDCDTVPDNGLPLVATYKDVDGDGFGSDKAVVKMDCLVEGKFAPPEYSLTNDDCDDSKSTAYPGAPELCDGVLNNCSVAKDLPPDYSCPTQCAGSWPFPLGGGVGTVAVAQLDADADLEIVVSQGGATSVLNPNGTVLWTGVGGTYSYPVLADVDRDDTLDVIVPYGGKLHVLHGTTGVPLFPALETPAVHSYYGAAAFDIDNDGYVDVVPTQLGTGPSPLVKFGAGAPSILELPSSGGPFFLSNAALWDHDGNGQSSIFLGSGNWSCSASPATCQGRLHVFDSAAALVFDPTAAGGPFTNLGFPNTYSSEGQWPVVADFDADGVAELAANFSDGIYVFNKKGALHPLTKTDKVGGVLYAPIEPNGALSDGKLNRTSGPAVDLEGDGIYETFSQSSEGLILTSKGKVAPGYPLPIKGYPPVVGDFNRDGALDIVWIGDNNSLNCQTLKPKTYKNERVLFSGGFGTVGAGGVYPTQQHDPYEPNQPSAVVDPKTSTNPQKDFRAFSPLGMRLAFQSGAGNRHLVTAELGEKGDEDWYFFDNSYTQIDVVSHVPSRLAVTMDVYAYLPDAGGWTYACEATGSSLYFHPLNATGTCPVNLGQKGLLVRVRGVDPAKDYGPFPYSLTFIWRLARQSARARRPTRRFARAATASPSRPPSPHARSP